MAEIEPQSKGEALHRWEFPEYEQHVRSRAWYLSFLVIVLVVVATSILSGNYTFVFIVMIAAFIYLVRMRRQPPLVEFTIYEDGVQAGTRFYPWNDFKEFVILYRPPELKKLYLDFKSSVRPSLDISLETENPLRVRSLLSDYLPENIKREEEPLTDQWSRFLKL
jgi:hypothetical protein